MKNYHILYIDLSKKAVKWYNRYHVRGKEADPIIKKHLFWLAIWGMGDFLLHFKP